MSYFKFLIILSVWRCISYILFLCSLFLFLIKTAVYNSLLFSHFLVFLVENFLGGGGEINGS